MATTERARRLSPDARRAQLLTVARQLLGERGMAGFTLEAVAAEAGVTAPLLRHYFASRDGLLLHVSDAAVREVLAILLAPRAEGGLAERLDDYLAYIEASPWAHRFWLHAEEIHPDLDRMVAGARRQLAAFSFAGDWDTMADAERLAAIGFVGYVEAVVAAWIADGLRDRGVVLATLAQAAQRLGVRRAA